MKKVDSKTTMLLHSEAKVEFFRKYLERYIRIIGLSDQFTQINIFDVFCGTGIYDNGKKGSPIAAFECMKLFREEYRDTRIELNLFVNDSASEKVGAVKSYIESENRDYCCVNYTTNPAEVSFQEIGETLLKQNGRIRNLVFIDPYGYKEIDRGALEAILNNRRTEMIMFLPISHMRRFTSAIDRDEAPFLPLKKFVRSFFSKDHPIHTTTLSQEEYVRAVKEALSFGQYYSTSFEIERDSSNRYALFFISPHIYGYEQILDVKWSMDEEAGRGFSQPDPNPRFDFFLDEAKVLAQEANYLRLEGLIRGFLSEPKDNLALHTFVLEQEFSPKHANEVLRRWQDASLLEVKDFASGQAVRKGWFYLGWKNYKLGTPKVRFTLKTL